MKVRYNDKQIDEVHKDEFKMNGCNVRLFFTGTPDMGIIYRVKVPKAAGSGKR